MNVWMATVITLLGSGDPTVAPEVRVNPSQFLSMAECTEWEKNMRTQAPVAIDTPTGKPIMGTFYKCVPVRDNMLTELQEAVKNNP
ncbi:hypothetical protein [Agrobacterium sp. CG674]